MAITNYSELQSAIRSWGARSDTTTVSNAQIEECIALCEDRLETLLPVREAVDFETLTGTIDSRVLTPANGFVEARALYMTTFGGSHERLTPFTKGVVPYDLTAGVPDGWTTVGQTIELNKPCDQAHTFEFLRRVKIYDLANTDPNWVLTNHPGVYLAGSMVEFYSFIQEFDKSAGWEQRFQNLISDIRDIEETSPGQAFVDAALSLSPGFNIESGYY